MTDKTEPTAPDLKSLLAEASRPTAQVTVPLKQGHRDRIAALEAEMQDVAATGGKPRRAAGPSPIKEKAAQIEALRQEMRASSLTFYFEAPTEDDIEDARKGMAGRDDDREYDLRLTAATCVRVDGPDGEAFPERMAWTDFRDLRKALGEPIYLATIKAKSDEVFRREWSVPFSSAASLILGTET